MARCPSLPFLPGMTFNPNIGRTKFNRDCFFDYIAPGVMGLVEKVRPNMLGPLGEKYPSLYPRGEVPEVPTWIAFDKQILKFEGFFKETLQEFHGIPYTVRKVKILFFLEDGTILVSEPKVNNSGISQGTLMSRQRIRFPAPMDANFYDILDLNIGKEVEFFGRVIKITDCDRFTRNFLNRCGISVPDPIKAPIDPYLDHRSHEGDAILPKKPRHKVDKLGKFLKNDQKVLRFYAYWDDQETDFGYLHYLEINYFLADDTIEIKEKVTDSYGHESGFTFIRRSQIPKVYKGLPGAGANTHFTVLNVLGSGTGSFRYVVDALDCGKEKVDFYGEQDLSIGGVLNIYGRKIVLTDCDPFTKEYYRVKYGIDTFTATPYPDDLQKVVPGGDLKTRELPPWNGYGSFEDSAQNCRTVELKPINRDMKKFLKYDRTGLDSHVLRFEARMISKIPENCSRIFVISYFLGDDSIMVYEIAKQNSGFKTSRFLRRGEVKLPGQPTFTSKPHEIYKPQHMFIGATLNINGYQFVLIDADDYALRYMEINAHEYPKANIKVIMDKVREVLRPIYKDFVGEMMPHEVPVVLYSKLRDKLCRVMGNDFTEHEMITIARAFSANCVDEKYNRETIRAITLTELKRYLWDDLDRLSEYFQQWDHHKTGKLERIELYTLMKGSRLPVDVLLIERILDVIKRDEHGLLYYQDLLDFLNRDKCPITDVTPVNVKTELWWTTERDPKAGTLINWCEFNKALDLEQTFKDAIGNFTGEEHAHEH